MRSVYQIETHFRHILACIGRYAYIGIRNVLGVNCMGHSVSLDRDAFRRGVEDVLTLKPLRNAASAAFGQSKDNGRSERRGGSSSHTVTVTRTYNSGWHVKRAS